MLSFELTKNTRELLAKINAWAVESVRPHARGVDDTYSYPAAFEEVAAKCPITHNPMDFYYTGPGVRGREGEEAYTASLNGGGAFLGILATEEVYAGDGWGWQALPGNNIGETAVRRLGSPAQAARWADGIARGDYKITSICMTEKHCGLDLSQIRTTAVKDGDHWILNGSKHYISHGAISDYLVVIAQTRPGSGFAGTRAFIVERGDEGLVVTNGCIGKLGTRFFAQAGIEFHDVRLPADRLLDNGTLIDFMSVMNGTRPFCAASGIGIARGMLDYAVDWMNAFDKPWSPRRKARIEEMVAECRAALARARRMALTAAWVHDQGEADNVLAQKSKAYAAPIFQGVAFRAMQLMGPEAWSKDHLMEKWYRDSKFFDIVEGTRNLHRIAVARAEYGRAAAG
jgi:alkylation response protein AidB-like acyl-CoA dehydrogenase